jgi:uncharacterized cupredoxin-like copper-binding protein
VNRRRIATALCLAIGVTLIGWSTLAASAEAVEVEVLIRHTAFDPEVLTVHAGTTVQFVVHNLDPIDHEFLLGDRAAQDAHERGTEAHHGSRPGEISVGALSTASTTYRFDEPGTVLIGCHLPGHWSHGMRGRVIVLP